MKKLLILLLSLTMVFGLVGCNKGNNDSGNNNNSANPLAGTYNIKMWVSEVAGVKELFQKHIQEFCDANPGIVINATIEGVTEANAATLVLNDVETAPDMYCFAQDQLARLVQADALLVAGSGAAEEVRKVHDATSVSCASFGDKVYAYPITGDNGYFMFYDKSVVKAEHLNSLEDIIKDCEAANKQISFELENAWYTASFFIATGCKDIWTANPDGTWADVDDTYNSAEGLVSMKALQVITQSKAYVNSSKGDDATGSAVIVSGTWATDTIKKIWGDNYGAAALPSFTVDGKTYHLGSFSGIKMIGIKPSNDNVRNAVLQQLALYLSSEKCSKERFDQFSWGPSVKAVQESDAVKNDVALTAFYAQSAYAIPQGQINDGWWGIAGGLGASAKTAKTGDEAALKKALEDYQAAVEGLVGLEGYVFVGAWNGWNNSDKTFKLAKNGDVYTIELDVPQSDYMGGRIVSITTWENDKGCAQVVNGKDLINEPDPANNPDNNIIFKAAGRYAVTYNETSGEISIEKK
ncbi:MAG: extracellular solute-binding protein [Erysipelotrichaceae bacterium]|nr:extracellular solute-binding protein [Erysipelotrichaceae bacterium]